MSLATCVAMLLTLASCGEGPSDNLVRLGHFPNVTHAHGLIAHALSRRGEGIFEKHVGKDIRVEWYVFHAGPSAMEALLARSLDATYVGPSPAINAHVKTDGDDVRVIAGATNGGSALVVRDAAGIAGAADFRGRRIATPQLGNTQDVACRAWLAESGYSVSQTGGDVHVIPTANPDQLALFQQGQLDAAWTVEPWVSRLESEGGGRVLVSETDAVTTVFVTSARVTEDRPQLARQLLAAHRELTGWIRENQQEAKRILRDELSTLIGRPVAMELIERCWPRLEITDTVRPEAFQTFLTKAKAAGFLHGSQDLSRFVHTP